MSQTQHPLRSFLSELQESTPSHETYEFGTSAGSPSSQHESRASIRRLRAGKNLGISDSNEILNFGSMNEAKSSRRVGKKVLFGMWEGVFVRCLLNIFGVIMFLRLGWMVAFGGVLLAVLVVVLSSSITMVTTLSLSAICTNGKIAGGGAYYLISRALGPEFGGSIGLLLYLATSTSVSLYLLGFSETLINHVNSEILYEAWDERLFALFGLILVFLLCIIGVGWVIKVEKFLLLLLLAAVSCFFVGVALGPDAFSTHDPQILPIASRNVGPAWSGAEPINLQEVYTTGNTSRSCSRTPNEVLHELYGSVDFGVLLAVFFPAVCGILAGANISGDLKDPSRAIPDGTILSIISSTTIYVAMITLIGFAAARVVITDYVPYDPLNPEHTAPFTPSGPEINGGDNSVPVELLHCQYKGLYFDSLLVSKASALPPLVYAGIYAASLSSALGAFVGAPRILQSLARDRLFPILTPFGKGFGHNDEPLRAYGLTFFIVTVCILSGDLNSVAPLITTFFLASYALINYACFAVDSSETPGWRPSFQFFNPWLALFGAIVCVGAMLMLSAIMGFVTFVLGLGFYKYIEVTNRGVAASLSHWGPAREAAQYNAAHKAALRLEAKEHVEQIFHQEYEDESSKQGSKGQHDANSHDEGIVNQRQNGNGIDEIHQSELKFPGTYPTFPESYSDVTHVKNFRPQCLVLTGAVEERPALAILAMGLRKARGVTLFGDVLIGNFSDQALMERRKLRTMRSYVSEFNIKGFNEVVIAPTLREGTRSMLQLGGLGRAMKPNTLMMGYLDSWKFGARTDSSRKKEPGLAATALLDVELKVEEDLREALPDVVPSGQHAPHNPVPSAREYVGLIGDAFDLGCGVVILRGEHKLLGRDHLLEASEYEKQRAMVFGQASPGLQPGAVADLEDGSSLSGASVETPFGDSGPELVSHRPGAALQYISRLNPVGRLWKDITNPDNNRSIRQRQQLELELQAMQQRGRTEQRGPGARDVSPTRAAFAYHKRAKRIDVWWITDDGGLTLMVPHLLRSAKSPPFAGCSLRVMAVGASEEEANEETVQMRTLLQKLRISAQVRTCKLDMSGLSSKGDDGAGSEEASDGFEKEQKSTVDESNERRSELYRQIGLQVQTKSADAFLAVVSLPVPPVQVDPDTYLGWLEALSGACSAPVLFVRGAQREALTVHG